MDGNLVRIPDHKRGDICFIHKKKDEEIVATITITATNGKKYKVCMDCLGSYNNISDVITACEE